MSTDNRRVLVIVKRIKGEMFRLTCPGQEKPLAYHLSGGIRDHTGESKMLLGQQEVSVQLFPGEQVELTEEVQG